MLNTLIAQLPTGWQSVLQTPNTQGSLRQLTRILEAEVTKYTIYPSTENIFRALTFFEPQETRVVILGQDPYINPGQAMGLSFSVPRGVSLPPSLQNIFKEIQSELGQACSTEGDLSRWARQGVLLLNTTLTVRAGQSLSHFGLGWETVTDYIIRHISEHVPHCAYMLWGNNAIRKARLINEQENLVLTAPHPSPLSAQRGFFGCGHFQQANAYLQAQGRGTITG